MKANADSWKREPFVTGIAVPYRASFYSPQPDRQRRTIARIVAVAMLPLTLGSCTSSIKRLDEAVVLDLPALRLKVVRFYENLPWHYSGEIYVVQCATPQTRSMPPRTKTDERGWAQVERGGAIGSGSASEIAERIRKSYRIIEGRAIIIAEESFKATLDGCQTFVYWNGWDLPDDWVHQVPKPAYCKDARPACPWENFRGERSLRFSEVNVNLISGQISMSVDSTALKNNMRLSVSSVDGGKTWTVVPMETELPNNAMPSTREDARA